MMEALESLMQYYGEERIAGMLNEYGLDVSGDQFLLRDSLRKAEKAVTELLGKITSLNNQIFDGLCIDFNEYEEFTEKRWMLEGYLKAARKLI